MNKSNIIPMFGAHQPVPEQRALPIVQQSHGPSPCLTFTEAFAVDAAWREMGYDNMADFVRDAILAYAGLRTDRKPSNQQKRKARA